MLAAPEEAAVRKVMVTKRRRRFHVVDYNDSGDVCGSPRAVVQHERRGDSHTGSERQEHHCHEWKRDTATHPLVPEDRSSASRGHGEVEPTVGHGPAAAKVVDEFGGLDLRPEPINELVRWQLVQPRRSVVKFIKVPNDTRVSVCRVGHALSQEVLPAQRHYV